MKSFSKWFSAMAAVVLLAGPAVAADAIAAGKVKAINADKKEFVLTDSAGKDWTIKLGDNVVINRGGKESKSDLNAGDTVNVCYDKGLLTWTAHYILVQEGDTKNCELVHGTVKSYDADKKQVTFTDRGQGLDLPHGPRQGASQQGRQQDRGHQDRRQGARHRGKDGGGDDPEVPDGRSQVTEWAKSPAGATAGHPARRCGCLAGTVANHQG